MRQFIHDLLPNVAWDVIKWVFALALVPLVRHLWKLQRARRMRPRDIPPTSATPDSYGMTTADMFWALAVRAVLLWLVGALFLTAAAAGVRAESWSWQVLTWLGTLFMWSIVAGVFWADASGQFERRLFADFSSRHPQAADRVRRWVPNAWLAAWLLMLLFTPIIAYAGK